MSILHDQMRLHVSKKIVQAALEIGSSMSVNDIYMALVNPPNPELGDLSFGCFLLAKSLRLPPQKISTDLAARLKADEFILKYEAVGPYLNITFSTIAFGEFVLKQIINGETFKQELLVKSPRTMIEYSQPNTHKELHVGHMRNLCLGDSLVRLFRYSGREIVASTFPGDVGAHVAKCLWYMKHHNTEPIPASQKGEWLGRMYSKGNIKLEDELGTPLESKNRLELTEILKQLEAKSGSYYDLWKETRQWSVDLMQEIYSWADVKFDNWYWESDVDSDSVRYAQKLLEQGKLVKSEGAVGMNLEEDKLGFCMLLKSDGTGLYATKDIELARRKFQETKIEKSIYVVDTRQALHFKQVFRVLEILGFEQAKDCYHLQYNFVELPDGAMSSRKGNIVPLKDLIHKMEEMVKTNYLSRYEGDWSTSDVDLVASQVAKGAIRYGMLRMDTNKKIVFDMNEWLKLDGESGPFIQYSAARISSLCRKFSFDQVKRELESGSQPDWSLLSHKSERQLMQVVMNFNTEVEACATHFKPAALCTYLYELAKRFNSFYHDCSIGNAESVALQKSRLALAYSVGAVLKQGLELLGIPTPEKM